MEKTVNTPSEPTLDMSAVIARYKRYWWLFVIAIVVALTLAAMYLYKERPTYLIISTVLVDQDDNSSGAGASLLKSMSLGIGSQKVDDEVVVMGSQELCRNMIAQLKLNRNYIERKGFLKSEDHYGTSPIEIDAADAVFDTLSIAMQFRIDVATDGRADITVKRGMFKTLATVEHTTLPATVKTPYGLYVVRTTPTYKSGKAYRIHSSVMGNDLKAEELMKQMTVRVLSKKSNAIYLDVLDKNVDRGRDKLNTLITLYNKRGQLEKDEQAVNTAKFIDERLGLIYKDLMGSEAEIEAYKRAHNMVDVQLQTKSLIGKQEQADQALVALETRRRIVQMIKDFVSQPANARALIPFSADSTAASGAIQSYNALVMQRMKLENSALDNNQALKQLDDQIEVMRQNVLKGVDNTLGALRIQIGQAAAVSSQSGSQMSGFPTEERQMRSLYREQGIQNTLYTFLLQKREENALVLAATTPKGKVVDHAYAKSEPVRPKKVVVLLTALLAGLLIPALLLYLKNLLNTKFASTDELESLTTIPVVGHIHHNRKADEHLVVRDGSTRTIVELFRYVRNNVQFMLPSQDDKVVLVTSSVSGEGKTFISSNLAAAFALLGKRVALVGMDIRKPQLASVLQGINAEPGVTNFLSQYGMTLDEVVQRVGEVDNLDVLVAGPVPPNPSELLLGDRVGALMTQLRERYDIIVVDSAPIAMVSDSFSLAKWASATIIVTRAGFTRRSQIKYINRLVADSRLPHPCIVLNDTKPRNDAGYGYGYGNDSNN